MLLEIDFCQVVRNPFLMSVAAPSFVDSVEVPEATDLGSLPASRFTNLAGWILVAALIYAPWAFDSRTYRLADGLAVQLTLAVVAWTVGLTRERRWPHVPVSVVLCTGSLIAIMWLGLWNAASTFDPAADRFIPRTSLAAVPANVDARNGFPSAICLSSILLAMVVTADLAVHETWRRRLLRTMGWTVLSVILAGLILKTGAFPALERSLAQRPWSRGDVFGPLDYHGNVATLINLSLPALALQAALARTILVRALMLAALSLLIFAVCLNMSRTGLGITLVSAGVLSSLIAREWRRHVVDLATAKRHGFFLAAIGLATITALSMLAATGRAQSVARLKTLWSEVSNPWNARYLQDQAAWQMVGLRPYFGGGVGSYKLLVQQSSLQGQYLAG